MNKKELSKLYNEKINLINKYNKFYYDNSKPIVSDNQYDLIKKQILDLEKKHSFLNSPKSPSKNVGYKPSKTFNKVKHRAPMLSLSNAFSEEDLINFEKIIKFLSRKNSSKIFIALNPN